MDQQEIFSGFTPEKANLLPILHALQLIIRKTILRKSRWKLQPGILG
jgi:hypothetical protein